MGRKAMTTTGAILGHDAMVCRRGSALQAFRNSISAIWCWWLHNLDYGIQSDSNQGDYIKARCFLSKTGHFNGGPINGGPINGATSVDVGAETAESEDALLGLHPNDERHLGWLVTDVARLMRTVFDRRVRTLGLTRPQWLALVRLKRRPGVSQSELADMMEIEKAPAGRIVDRMQEKRWIERRPDPGDRRINRIYLTDRGERVHAAIWPISTSTVTDALTDLDAADRENLTELLSRVKVTLAGMSDSDPAPEIDWSDEDTTISEHEAPAL